MRNMKKISALVLAASVAFGLLSGCGQSASGTTAAKAAATTAKSAAAATTAAAAKTTVAAAKTTAAAAKTTAAAKTATTAAKSGSKKLTKVTLSAQPAAHSLGIYAAKEKGWFEEEGLDVEILSYISGSPQLEAVASNAWTVGIMGPPAGITGSLKNGLTIVGFSVWDQPSQRLFVRKDSDIAKAGTGKVEKYPKIYGTADMWKGKNIICTKGSLGHLQLLATLKALGLKEADVNIIHMDMAAGYQAFLAGQGDAICTWSTFTSDALAAGYVQASSAEDAGLKAPSMVTASEKAMADPELTQKIINVIFRGTMWANENKDEAAKIYYDVCQEAVPLRAQRSYDRGI